MKLPLRVLAFLLTVVSGFDLHASTTEETLVHDSSGLVVRSITLIGNKITRDGIVLRELSFSEGDTIVKRNLEARIKRSEDNLFNTRLFNTVDITYLEDSGNVRLFVIMNERWYIFPVPLIEVAERNFNAWWSTKDFSRLVYGVALNWRNVTGRNDLLVATIRLGYYQRLSFSYSRPYIDKARKIGLSCAMSYSRNHETNIETVGNKQRNFKQEPGYVKEDIGGGIGLTYRPGLYLTHSAEVGYRRTQVSDSVPLINPDYFGNGDSTQRFISLRYAIRWNRLDITQFPTDGYYLEMEMNKVGLRPINDDVDLLYLVARMKKFWTPGTRWSLGTGISAKLSMPGYQPFYNTRALGYGKDVVRGYEYYVVDGQDFLLLKSSIRFALVPKKILHAGFVPSSKFNTIPLTVYAGVFADAGYVRDDQYAQGNPLTNTWQYGYGAGLELFTAYDLIMRLEYSFNKLGESGFFLHFTAPI
ncbi:MAG: BamA/TamA family outer membrane protein [Bacteroidota bacterium]